MYLKQGWDIFKLYETSLKFVDQYVYIGSNILSIKRDDNVRIGKELTVINRKSIIWKCNVW